MPYLFTCPHCQTKTQVDERYSGQKGACVTCGGEIKLPHFTNSPVKAGTDRRWKPVTSAVAATVVLILLLTLAYAAIRQGQQTMGTFQSNRQRSLSIRNLEQIASALNAYAADHGTYPPPFTTDAAGTPLQSWRVLILPYLGEDELYESIDRSAAWDAANNLPLAYSKMPGVYRHPDNPSSAGTSESAYYIITGDQTLFPSSGPLGPNDVVDDPLKTILVVEANPSMISGVWTEPVDLNLATIQGIGGLQTNIGGRLDGGSAIVTIDERGHFLDENTPASTLRALVTPRGGEPLADDTLD
ncbi:hypothetical protein Pla52o_02630 [Novipirellula galeiformis]|uniref:DUF1559 domain-containing protein n=1 Tax=Novipirellula galeiformis TaxID=2528004 RepID=A0A5C6CPE7_9BACT|nr:DUF1559 domain-containing protein [Novipirellula galeiformis]TWU26410.1 hypothetical protein Pla52o_02630 [Novipirellula galeiformis]